jgi:hypothetical protein
MTRKTSPTQPRIAPQVREQKAQLNVRVAARTLQLVREYAAFIESGLDYTVNAALLLALEDDAAFQTWRAEREAQARASGTPKASTHADAPHTSDEE